MRDQHLRSEFVAVDHVRRHKVGALGKRTTVKPDMDLPIVSIVAIEDIDDTDVFLDFSIVVSMGCWL